METDSRFRHKVCILLMGIQCRENVLERIEKLDTYIATRTCIVRNAFTIADIAMWAAIKSMTI